LNPGHPAQILDTVLEFWLQTTRKTKDNVKVDLGEIGWAVWTGLAWL
jgi:hypothetical protein